MIALSVVMGLLAVAGLYAFVRGVLGSPVATSPCCANCRFDLSGSPSASPRCPECGHAHPSLADLVAVTRRRSGRLMIAGLSLAVPAAALLGLAVAVGRYGVDPNRAAPAWWLLTRARSSDHAVASPALNEFLRRLEAGQLGSGQVRRIVGEALKAQGDRGRAWNPDWGSFVEVAWIKGFVSEEEQRRYAEQSFAVDLMVSGFGTPGPTPHGPLLTCRAGYMRLLTVDFLVLYDDATGAQHGVLVQNHPLMNGFPGSSRYPGEEVISFNDWDTAPIMASPLTQRQPGRAASWGPEGPRFVACVRASVPAVMIPSLSRAGMTFGSGIDELVAEWKDREARGAGWVVEGEARLRDADPLASENAAGRARFAARVRDFIARHVHVRSASVVRLVPVPEYAPILAKGLIAADMYPEEDFVLEIAWVADGERIPMREVAFSCRDPYPLVYSYGRRMTRLPPSRVQVVATLRLPEGTADGDNPPIMLGEVDVVRRPDGDSMTLTPEDMGFGAGDGAKPSE